MGLNKSNPTSVWSPNGNSLAVFVNALNDQLFLKDAIGNIQPLSDFISNPSGSSPYGYDACTGSIKPVLGTNCTNGQYSTIGGGQCNLIVGNGSYIGAGVSNSVCQSNSFIGSGCQNLTTGQFSFVGNGLCNVACENYAFVGSGARNVAQRNNSVIVGGENNTVTSRWGFIGSGFCNTSTAKCFSAIVGGQYNEVCGNSSFVGGGCANKAYFDFSVTSGGCQNSSLATGAVVVGGTSNSACGIYSFIGSGSSNITCCAGSFIGAGSSNIAVGNSSFIGAGNSNCVIAEYGSILGGKESLAYLYGMQSFSSGAISTVGGAQESKLIARANASLDASAQTELFLDGVGELIIPFGSNRAWNVYVDFVSVCTVLGSGTTGGLAVGDVFVGTSSFYFKKVTDVSSISTVTDSNPNFDVSMSGSRLIPSVGAGESLKIEFKAPSTAGTGTTFNVVAKIKLVEVAW